MSRQGWHAARPHGARAYVLLVLAVLAGVLAMHGLGPAVASPVPHHSAAADSHHGTTPSAASHTDMACEDCSHVDHGDTGTGGHAEHADTTCAAGGTSTAPALPALAATGVVTCAAPDTAPLLPGAPATGRAPPSLSELQLLRI
ncbi:DUF6153 family protein [Streptomyces sp. NPDC049597]|uniref:DUF6153 family protein n=1 Tax=Streptomyces sp. NPDC049597 TaxID=3155276 RepID=UPI00342DFCB4